MRKVFIIFCVLSFVFCKTTIAWKITKKESEALSEKIISTESIKRLLFLDEISKHNSFSTFSVRIIDKTKKIRFCSSFFCLNNGNYVTTFILYDIPANLNSSIYFRDIVIFRFTKKKDIFYLNIGATTYQPNSECEKLYYFVEIHIKEKEKFNYDIIFESVSLPNLSGMPHKYYEKKIKWLK